MKIMSTYFSDSKTKPKLFSIGIRHKSYSFACLLIQFFTQAKNNAL